MTIWQSVLSGIVQGITEFFPVSSTGHLVLLHNYFGFQESQMFFDIVLHLATGLAVLVYFREDVKNLFGKDKNLGLLVVLGSVPTFIIGFIFAGLIEEFFVSTKLVGAALLVTGFWLIAANIVNKTFFHEKHMHNRGTALYPWKALVIGAAQGVALVPGISRSGATIATGLLCGLGSNLAFRFSFLLLLPATIGATVFKLKDVKTSIPPVLPMLLGAVVAFAVGLVALHILSKILKQGRIHIFGFYCLALGLLVLLS